MSDKVINSAVVKPTNYNCIDLVKFICALLVVVLHVTTYTLSNMAVDGHPPTGAESGPLVLYVLPLAFCFLRVAVPFFFISSAFFLFKKANKCQSKTEKNNVIIKYCLRILKLYLFWTLISLPYMVDKCVFNSGFDLSKGFAVYALRFVTLNSFDGAWYLGASIIAALIVYFLSTKVNNYALLGITFVLYIVAVLDASYFNIFTGITSNSELMFLQTQVPLYESFFSGCIFFALGKIFADKENRLSLKQSILLTIFFFIMMYGELFTTNYFGLNYATDAFFMLVPFSFFFFQMILNIKLKDKKAYPFLRKSSTYIYLIHMAILYVMFRFVYKYNWTIFTTSIPVMVATYIGVVGLSILLFMFTNWLSKKMGFKWLKYSI